MTPDQARAELAKRELARRGQQSDSIDFSKAGQSAWNAAANPSPENMTQGGFDPIQRAAQAGMGSVYEQAKKPLVNAVPERARLAIGDTIQRVAPVTNLFPKKSVGDFATGTGIDLAAGAGADMAMSKAPSFLAKNIIEPLANTAEKTGGRILNSYIKPKEAGYSFGKNPGLSVARHIGPQWNREGLLKAVDSKTEQLLNEMESGVKGSNSMVDIGPVRQHFNDIISSMKDFPETYSNTLEAHRSFARDLDNLLKKGGASFNGDQILITPETALKIKRGIGKLPSWNVHDPKLGSITKTARETYGKFDKAIDKAVPGNVEKNADISNLIGASQGLEHGAMRRQQNSNPFGLMELIGGAAAGHGNILSPEAILTASAIKGMKSAPFNTTLGSAFGKLGQAGKAGARFLESVEQPSVM